MGPAWAGAAPPVGRFTPPRGQQLAGLVADDAPPVKPQALLYRGWCASRRPRQGGVEKKCWPLPAASAVLGGSDGGGGEAVPTQIRHPWADRRGGGGGGRGYGRAEALPAWHGRHAPAHRRRTIHDMGVARSGMAPDSDPRQAAPVRGPSVGPPARVEQGRGVVPRLTSGVVKILPPAWRLLIGSGRLSEFVWIFHC